MTCTQGGETWPLKTKEIKKSLFDKGGASLEAVTLQDKKGFFKN